MSFSKFIIILPLLCWGPGVKAQEPQEAASLPEQWQLTLDVIKSKAQTLMVENNGLEQQHQQLLGQLQELMQATRNQQDKNEQLSRFIKERHGRTDQEFRVDELKQAIRTKKQQVHSLEDQLDNLRNKQSDLERQILNMNNIISDIKLRQQEEKENAPAVQSLVQSQADGQLTQLRQQLEEGNRQEILLGNELQNLKNGEKTKDLNVEDIETANKQLEARLDVLRLQKLQHERVSSDTQLAQANRRMYEKLKKRKDELEANISTYETRLDELRESSLMTLSWPHKKKKLIHDMVQADARNNQTRDNIKVLREDIGVLKEQIAKLERHANFIQGKGSMQ